VVTDNIPAQRRELRRLVNGYQISQAIYALTSLGIFERLNEGRHSADELARATGADVEALYRVLRALAAVGVLKEVAGRRFTLTPIGDGLRSNVPASLAGWAGYVGRPYVWQAWGHLENTIRTGTTAFRLAHGTDIWAYRASRPSEVAIFNRAMNSIAAPAADAVLSVYDFSPFRHIIDVGGGGGALADAILSRYSSARVVLFDRPEVVASARSFLDAAGVADRCQVVAGSFFESVPPGGDCYILKSVLHDWLDDEAGRILRSCHSAMTPGAKLLVIERVVGPPNEDADTKLADLNMLVAAGGHERTREEWESLLSSAAFRLSRVVTSAGPLSVIETSA
jgi:hypothetical protein